MLFEDLNVTIGSLTLAVISIALLRYYLRRNFHVFKKAGIPGPEPLAIFGNALDALSATNLMSLDLKLSQKYGKFVGTFVGSDPMLLVYDADWLNEAFIKHFDVFTNRNTVQFGGAIDSAILSIEGDHWRHARKTLSPVFTTFKLRQMIPSIQSCVNIFNDVLQDSHGKPVDTRSLTNLLTLDVISTTAFGVVSDAQTNPDGKFATHAFLITNSSEMNNTFMEKLRLGVVVTLHFFAPTWFMAVTSKLFNLHILNSQAIGYFESLVESVIDERKKEASPATDLLQTLTDSIVEAPSGHADTLSDADGIKWTRKGLTLNEVVGNSLLFLFAGFQTTADTMMFIFYELAHQPDIEQRLYEEIIEVCNTEEVTVEQVNKLKYLENCINEAMRLYPQGFRFDRVATKDITVQGIHVSKGTIVTASPWVIHRDADIWENPENFDPERFSPERLTDKCLTAFIPFGIGNRQCIGSRLAMLEMKMTVISTLKRFQIRKNSLTPDRPIKFKNTKPLVPMCTEQPIMISFVNRED